MRSSSVDQGLAVPQLLKPLVIDSEVVGEFVEDGDSHLVGDLVRQEGALEGPLEDDDLIGQGQLIVHSLGQRDPDIEAEERVAREIEFMVRSPRLAIDRDLGIGDLPTCRGREIAQCTQDQTTEPIAIHPERADC